MDEELEKYRQNMSQKRRVRQQALAVLRRAKEAGIDEENMRISREQLGPLLCAGYFDGEDGKNKVLDFIYNSPMELAKKAFVVIDGGDIYSRKSAGFAILFRLIACDKTGLHETAKTLSRRFQTFTTNGVGRNDYLTDLLSPEVLFISDFHPGLLRSEGMGGGDFFDDLFEQREALKKQTIISFQLPLPGKQIIDGSGLLTDMRYGQYLCMLTKVDKKMNSRNNIFRVRVNIDE